MDLIRKRRIFYMLLLLGGLLLVLIIRLGYIQFISVNQEVLETGRTMREMSVLQREQGIIMDSGRGQFLDRHHKSLTGQMVYIPVLFPLPDQITEEEKNSLLEVADVLKISNEVLWAKWSTLTSPECWKGASGEPMILSTTEAESLRNMNIDVIKPLPYMKRYLGAENGRQWLGYLAELPEKTVMSNRHMEVKDPFNVKSGAGGLERSLEPVLKGLGPTIVSNMVDGHKNPLQGNLGARVIAPRNPKYPLNVETTVDIDIQEQVEKLTAQAGIAEGAVVVLDVRNADVVAMVSRPFYDPEHISMTKNEWGNQALKAAVPGSIFKIVTAAAALEQGVVHPNEKFHCTGHYGKYGLSCWKTAGHGILTFEEGFAQSCNITFAEVASRLSAKQITDTANSLGLGRAVGFEQNHYLGQEHFRLFDHEEKGSIFNTKESIQLDDEGARIQTAIGQRDVKVTPLQAANLIVTLLHGGEVLSPRIVAQIHYADGTVLAELPEHRLSGSSMPSIRKSTANKLLHFMDKVVEEGTGQALKQATWHLAGKSGTAQVLKNSRKLNHQWFIGYGPVESPRYAVAVLVKHVEPTSKHKATQLFKQVMNMLATT
ncbi:penicillin-binding transpeptidase domain-containing protein [Paenibacillus sp. Marseille-Q4541]|uniref:peptidoglycan D,D-transpeptidase FtsI family protein n=1 Tax=Paenibacillus sp. Marseille-Q4541 TaxID=2831522 RepID=UPI001BAB60AD|nr:penicillin-binding transpeptidase domain-containing protein [Paenibacillus sp. Marseille-Q4541]